jgi:hypothetical protein
VEGLKSGLAMLSFYRTMHATLYYRPKVLQGGEFKEAFERAVITVLGSDFEIAVKYPRHSALGVNDDITLDAESLRGVVDLSKADLTLILQAKNVLRITFIACKPDQG